MDKQKCCKENPRNINLKYIYIIIFKKLTSFIADQQIWRERELQQLCLWLLLGYLRNEGEKCLRCSFLHSEYAMNIGQDFKDTL